jgi:uncharacterized protein YceH (UPF0502 family)
MALFHFADMAALEQELEDTAIAVRSEESATRKWEREHGKTYKRLKMKKSKLAAEVIKANAAEEAAEKEARSN